MDGHLVNPFLRESKQGGQEGIVILCGEQREVTGCHAEGKQFRLKEPTATSILHVVCGSSEERRKLFPGLWFNAQREWFDRVHVHSFSSLSCGCLARCQGTRHGTMLGCESHSWS